MLSAKSRPELIQKIHSVMGGLMVFASLGFLVALSLGWIDIVPHPARNHAEEEVPEARAATTGTVTLPREKLTAAKLHVTQAEQRMMAPVRDVPGEIHYDESRRVPQHAPVEGVVLQVLVEPAQMVTKGQPLAVLSCPEIGVARDAVEKRKTDLALARRDETRATDVARHVDELLALLRQKPKLVEVESALQNRMLGEYREKIIGAYSQLLFAERVSEASSALEGGPVSIRLIEQRKTDREQADAKFHGACEQARFSAVQDSERAKAAADQAERLLAVAQQALKNLLGPWAAMDEITDSDRLNELKLLAPVDGRVVERQAVQNARFVAGDSLFVVADTSAMWVAAEIHERDWSALSQVQPGDALDVRIAALAGEPRKAKIRWVGAQVDAVKRSVPLVAELTNEDGQLKPGMFVWTSIPLEKPHEAVTVPAGAVMRHDNQTFVFVPVGGKDDADDRSFRRVDVIVGIDTSERVEITSGLRAGEVVVDRGTFYLKSELLLEREE